MFFKKTQVEDDSKELKYKIEGLEKERADLQREVNDLKSQKKIEEQEIKHLVKIKDEKRELEYKKKEMELEQEKNEEIAKVKDDYRDKVEKNLEQRNKELKEMYGEILAIVPKVEAMVKVRGKG